MQTIGYVGVGIMGMPMVLNLLKAGHPVNFYARKSTAINEATEAGAVYFSSLHELAGASDVIITNVSDTPDVEEVVLGEAGLIHGMKSGALFIDMSTIEAEMSKKIHRLLADKGVEALDAPVSGGLPGAITGTLSIMVGGSEQAFERALPIFNILGKNIIHIGSAGAGQIAKACNQICVAANMMGIAEAMSLATRSGADAAKVRAALLGGFAGSKVLEVHGEKILNKDFAPGFKIDLFRKDLNIVLQTGRATRTPLQFTGLAASRLEAAIATGWGGEDFSALYKIQQLLAGEKEE